MDANERAIYRRIGYSIEDLLSDLVVIKAIEVKHNLLSKEPDSEVNEDIDILYSILGREGLKISEPNKRWLKCQSTQLMQLINLTR